jgi:hypothetical protein
MTVTTARLICAVPVNASIRLWCAMTETSALPMFAQPEFVFIRPFLPALTPATRSIAMIPICAPLIPA